MEDRLPDPAGGSGAARDLRARVGPHDRRRPDVVRGARDRLRALGAEEPVRVCAPLQRAGERLHLSPHRRVSAREPARRRAGCAALFRRRRVNRGLAARAALAATLAVVWTVAIWLLWTSTTVPSLHLPHLDPHAYFSAEQLRAAASYSRVERIIWLLGTIAKLGALVVFARYGVRWAKESAAGRMGTGMLLGMLGFALLWAVQVPFSVLELWWERRHHLSALGYVSVVLGNWLALGGQFVFLCLALAIVMGFARAVGDWWWLLAAPAFVGLALLFAFISPWLTSTHALRQPALRAAAVRLERIEHVRHTPI